jgi:ComF family protein
MTPFINWLLPQNCFLCEADCNQPICLDCLSGLSVQESTFFPAQEVIAEKISPVISSFQAIFFYTYPVNVLIKAAKFNNNLTILSVLGELMAESLVIKPPLPEVLIPVPLHPKRLRKRGYNQSLELAKSISQINKIPFAYQACQRIKNTPPQVSLSKNERLINLKKAFKVNQLKQHWRHVAIIDDVITTGTTVKELAVELRQAGIQRIDVWCCARSYDIITELNMNNYE